MILREKKNQTATSWLKAWYLNLSDNARTAQRQQYQFHGIKRKKIICLYSHIKIAYSERHIETGNIFEQQ